MKKLRVLATALAAAVLLAACGGSTPGDQSPRVTYGKMVNFGDSLSDVGSYRTALVASNGEGEYSINGDLTKEGLLFTNWTAFLAAQLGLTAPCAAETGLQSAGALVFMAETVAEHPECYSYAQGGARVTNPVGPGNVALWLGFGVESGQLGQITKPIVSQVAAHLAAHTSFAADDLVTVMAGGNDVFMNRATVDSTVAFFAAQGLLGTDTANAAIGDAAAAAVTAMQTAGTELAGYIQTKIVANGATHVVVVNLPDVAGTPDHAIWLAGAGAAVEPLHPHLTLDMVNAFNTALAAGLSVSGGESSIASVLWVDAFTTSDQQTATPAIFGLTNTTTPACDLTKTGVQVPGVGLVPIASSLFCTKASLIPDDTANATALDPTGLLHYEFADTVHPTPYGYKLLAQYVAERMATKGWL